LENTVRFPQAAQAVVVRILKKTKEDNTGERQQLTTREKDDETTAMIVAPLR